MKKPLMGHAAAERLARAKWGPMAVVARASSPDRNQRFRLAVVFASDKDEPVLQVLAYGSSWEEAFANAENNPVAKKWEDHLKERVKEMTLKRIEEQKASVLKAVEETEKNDNGSTNQQ